MPKNLQGPEYPGYSKTVTLYPGIAPHPPQQRLITIENQITPLTYNHRDLNNFPYL